MNRKVRDKVRAGLADAAAAAGRHAISRLLRGVLPAVARAFPEAAEELRRIKRESVERLDELVQLAVGNLRRNGFEVYRARTNREAVEYALRVIPPGSLVVKSKSNAVKETDLLAALRARGVRVVETDMGDRICQLGDLPAGHPLGPAVHVPVAEVAALFARDTGREVPAEPEAVVAVAREALRETFLSADCGLSGANAVAADVGAVVLTENEGNIRNLVHLTRVHLIFAGIEKIVPTLEDAVRVCRAAALYGVAQPIGQYVTAVAGPPRAFLGDRPADRGQGPREVHVVLLEQGRREAVRRGFGASLYCINCGACLNVCPVYNEIGERYGYRYFGGIGVVHAALRYGLEAAVAGGLTLCLSCRRCVEFCPCRIPTPDYIVALRAEANRRRSLPRTRRLLLDRFLESNSRAVHRTARVVQGLLARPVPDGDGVEARFFSAGGRLLPRVAPRPGLDEAAGAAAGRGPRRRKVTYFLGCLNNRFFVDVARATVEVLGHLGAEVVVARPRHCCGYPALVDGDPAAARRLAQANLEVLADAGEAVVVDCPTCGTALRTYADLLAEDPARRQRAAELAGRVWHVAQFVLREVSQADLGELPLTAVWHQPCHLPEPGSELLLKIPGLKVETSVEWCCGFGGAFSLEYYELARTIGSRTADGYLATGARLLVTACPGCLAHLRDALRHKGAAGRVMHVSEILARSLSTGAARRAGPA